MHFMLYYLATIDLNSLKQLPHIFSSYCCMPTWCHNETLLTDVYNAKNYGKICFYAKTTTYLRDKEIQQLVIAKLTFPP